jgi:hypothetical protein
LVVDAAAAPPPPPPPAPIKWTFGEPPVDPVVNVPAPDPEFALAVRKIIEFLALPAAPFVVPPPVPEPPEPDPKMENVVLELKPPLFPIVESTV